MAAEKNPQLEQGKQNLWMCIDLCIERGALGSALKLLHGVVGGTISIEAIRELPDDMLRLMSLGTAYAILKRVSELEEEESGSEKDGTPV